MFILKGDMTKGSIWRSLLLFMLPILLGNLLQQLYNTADSVIVGNFATAQYSLAAVATCSPASMLLVSLATGFTAGGGVVVAQYFGAHRMDDMKRSISTLILFTAGFGVLMTFVGVFFSKWFLRVILCVKPDILPLANTYMVIYSCGLIFSFVYNGVAAVLRALGNSASSLLFLTVSALSNIVLDVLFVAVFDWGVAGAAIATVLAQTVCAIVSFFYLLRKYGDFLPHGKDFTFDRAIFGQIFSMGLPSAMQSAAVNLGSVLLQRMVNGFGPANMEAFLAATRLDNILLAPTGAFGAALMSFTAQNIGAGNEERAKRGMYVTHLMNGIISLCLIVPITVFARPLIAFFGVSEAALELGVNQVRWVVPMMMVFALHVPGCSFIRGTGASMMASVSTLTAMFVRIVGAYTFVGRLGYAAPYTFLPVGWCFGFIVVWSYFFSGRWRGKALVKKAPAAQAAEEAPEEK